jgi:hypothetical protein
MTTDDFEARLGALNSSEYPSLRAAQAHVLSVYAARHKDTPDVAIELPTGVGKTLIALLIAEHALDREWRVAYLTGSNALTKQVADQARRLGVSAHQFSGGNYPAMGLLEYGNAQALAVMNYWVYFNSSPKVDPADLLIFDDAHLAEQPLTGLFSARIARFAHKKLYVEICDLVQAHTNAYETLPAMRNGTVPSSAPPELLAFNDWDAVSGSVSAAIEASDYAKADEGRFVWRELRGRLLRCGVLIGPSAIEIRPYLPPSKTLAGISESKQRIYMSATLGTMDDLERRLGIGPITRLDVPTELHAADTGRRLLALNPTHDSSLSQPLVELILDLAQAKERVAWLCSSHQEAGQVQGTLDHLGLSTFRLKPGDDTALESWRKAPNGHLIAAGRFDGLDFAGNVCRLVVIPSVPEASSEFERFVVAYLGDATFMRHRVGQRITQALGRANRLATDRSLYFGLDPAFSGVLAQPDVFGALDPAVGEVVRNSLQLHDDGSIATEATVRSFWRGHDAEKPAAKERRRGRSAASAHIDTTATTEVDASVDLWLGDFKAAAKNARIASDALAAAKESEHSAFWRYVEAQAHFSAGGDRGLREAVGALEAVVSGGPHTAWFIRLGRTLDDLRGRKATPSHNEELFLGWDAWLRESGKRAERDVAEARLALEGSHDQRCDGLIVLGRLLGVWAIRPVGASATDVRWTWNSRKKPERRLWEVKTGRTSERVSRDDINQVLGQLQIDQQNHPRARVYGCLMTAYTEMEADAGEAARERICALNEAAVVALFDLVASRFLEYHRMSGGGSAIERGNARMTVEPKLPSSEWMGRLLVPSSGHVIGRQDIEDAFRRGLPENEAPSSS